MEKQQLIERINEVLAGEFEVEVAEITPEASIKSSLQLDSLSLVDLVALIEEHFGVSIKGVEVSNIQTFDALYEFVFNRMQQ
jgi:acyl carrier protein